MLRAGLIGLPSSGKTTLFELLTRRPRGRRGRTEKPKPTSACRACRTRDSINSRPCFNPKKRVPATVEFADMAAGRGDAKSLVDVVAYRNADALLHVVRAFRDRGRAASAHDRRSGARRAARGRRIDPRGSRIGGTPARAARKRSQEDAVAGSESRAGAAAARRARRSIRAARCARWVCRWTTRGGCAGFSFCPRNRCSSSSISTKAISAMPIAQPNTPGLSAFLAETGAAAVGVCAKIELEISHLDAADAAAFLTDLGLGSSGLDRVIRAAYDLLGYMSFFTVGEDECRAWSIPRRDARPGRGRRDPYRHPARVHSRGSRAVRHAARARIARRVPRPRRAAARRQGLHRPGRRHDQFPPRHVIGFGPPSP